jgi:hypothetical protein
MASVSGPSPALQNLGIPRTAVQAQADYYLAYAKELESGRRNHRPRTVWTDLANPDQRWTGDAVLASTYRLAAQYLALIDPRSAGIATIMAAKAYLRAGLPFGAMLMVGLLDESMLRDRAAQRVMRTIRTMVYQPPTDDPVQRTYLLLTALTRPWLRRDSGEPIRALIRDLRAHELHPIGAQGRPVAGYLRLAETMANDESDSSEIVNLMVDTVTAVGRPQAENLRVAQRNSYLWQHAASPLDLVNLEDVAISGLLMRSDFMPAGSGYDLLIERLRNDDPLAKISLWVANDVSSDLLDSRGAVMEVITTDDEDMFFEDDG